MPKSGKSRLGGLGRYSKTYINQRGPPDDAGVSPGALSAGSPTSTVPAPMLHTKSITAGLNTCRGGGGGMTSAYAIHASPSTLALRLLFRFRISCTPHMLFVPLLTAALPLCRRFGSPRSSSPWTLRCTGLTGAPTASTRRRCWASRRCQKSSTSSGERAFLPLLWFFAVQCCI